MKRPNQESRFPNKPRSLDRSLPQGILDALAERARYLSSPYHCRDENGRLASRVKPASPCPRSWTGREGINAVRQAIRSGQISKARLPEGFPRLIWHREGDVWYEACTNSAAPGEYHGYPVEVAVLPLGLIR